MPADPFTAPHEGWTPVSPRLATARRLLGCAGVVAVTVAVVVVLVTVGRPEWAFFAVVLGLVAGAVLVLVVGRQVRAMGYAERSDDLLVVTGVMLRRLVIVPYGRMQLVDVSAGPVDRYFGLSTVQLHTAAATTDAAISGLSPTVAAALRDRLAAMGEKRSAGL